MKRYCIIAYCENFNLDNFDIVRHDDRYTGIFTTQEIGTTAEEIQKNANAILREYIEEVNADLDAFVLKDWIKRVSETGEDERYTLQVWRYEHNEDNESFINELNYLSLNSGREPDFKTTLNLAEFIKDVLNV